MQNNYASLASLLTVIWVGSFLQAQSKPLATSKTPQVTDFEFTDTARDDRLVPVRVYRMPSDRKAPVILFSHGLGGSRQNSPYLGNFWAEHGYVAVFIQHAGSDIDVIQDAPRLRKFQALKAAASLQSANNRVEDVSFVLDELERVQEDANHELHQGLDLEHVGLAGHSFGAVTTMTMAGRKLPIGKAVDEPRIDAFLAMSPQLGKGRKPEQTYDGIERPILCMTGTRDDSPIDRSVTPETRQKVFTSLPEGNKFQLVLEGAEHHAFGDGEDRRRRLQRDAAHHGIIQQLSLKFWDAYLKGEEDAQVWLQSTAPKQVEGFKAADRWAWK